jgi:hypothetical protein
MPTKLDEILDKILERIQGNLLKKSDMEKDIMPMWATDQIDTLANAYATLANARSG